MKYYLTDRRHPDYYDRAFSDFFRPFFAEEDVMKTDITETEQAYKMEIDLPGFAKNEIAMNYDNGYVTVSATKVEKKEDGKYLTRERTGSYSRRYYVGSVDKDAITAKYDNGVLTVNVPKENKQLSHAINID